MKSKKKSKQNVTFFATITIVLILLVTLVAIKFWKTNAVDDAKSTSATHTVLLKGTVTDDAQLSLTDSGESLMVNDIFISTSNKKSLHAGATYDADISNIKKGDKVEVKYIVDDASGSASLNCSTCYIKKIE